MYPSLRGLAWGQSTRVDPGTRSGERRTRVAATVVLLGVTSMLTDISSEMVSTVLPLYLTVQLGFSPLAYGLVDGLYQGVTVLVRLGGGVVADRSGRPKAVALVGYATSAVAKLALLPATSVGAISAVIAVDRAGKGVRTAPRDALIAASSPGPELGRAFGVHRSLDTTGAMIGPLLAFVMLAAVPSGYDAVFVTSFSFGLLGVAVMAAWVPDLRLVSGVADAAPAVSGVSLPRLLRQPAYHRALAAAGLLAAVTVSDGFLYLVLQRRTDLAPELFPLLFVGTALVYVLCATPVGRLADRVGRRRVFLAGHLALLGAYLCAGGIDAAGLATAGCLALLGLYYAATDGVLSALTTPMLPETLRSSGLAAMQTVTAGGRFAAALVFGLAWTALGPRGALLAFCVALAVVLPVGATLLRNVRGAVSC
jgi:MFS family permease